MKTEPKIKERCMLEPQSRPPFGKHTNNAVTHGCKGSLGEEVGEGERENIISFHCITHQ